MTRRPSRDSPGRRFIFAFAVVAAVASAAPARAADDQGWFVFLDLANAQPDSLDQHFANHFDFTNPATVVSERLVIDNDADLTFKIGGGYGSASRGRDSVGFSGLHAGVAFKFGKGT